VGCTFEKFTDRARRALVLAAEEARVLNHDYVGTEHILLGLIHEGDGLAAKALESLEISLEAVRKEVETTVGQGHGDPVVSPPFTPRAKKVLDLSRREALQLGHNYVGTEHILLGVAREGGGVAARALVNLGADMAKVRQAVIQLMSGFQGRDASGTVSLGSSSPGRSTSWVLAVEMTGRDAVDYGRAFEDLAAWLTERGSSIEAIDPADFAIVSIHRDGQAGFQLQVRREAL
jgi:ATP-dependent Clp protease ATP-binding subunit ClpC